MEVERGFRKVLKMCSYTILVFLFLTIISTIFSAPKDTLKDRTSHERHDDMEYQMLPLNNGNKREM